MALAGYLKVIILVLVLAVPIAIVFLVYRTLFSGLRSITTSRDPDSSSDENANQERAEDNRPSEKNTVPPTNE